MSPSLTTLTAASALVLGVSIVGYALDDRLVTAVSVWNKPAKFAISFLLWAPTLIAIFSRIARGRILRICLELLGSSMLLELILITMQAARGVTSHYNYTTPFDAAVFTAMGAGVGVMTVVAAIAGVTLARRTLHPAALGLAVKVAVPLMTLGAVSGFVMTSPRTDQDLSAGIIGGHTIGAVDGGPGLPLLGWSTQRGDLRVAHFVGLHALQAIPLVALLLLRGIETGRLSLSDREQVRIVRWASATYVGLMGLTWWQAMRGQPLTGPDGLTLACAVLVLALPGAVALALVRRGARRARDQHDDGFASIEPDDIAG